MFCELFDMAWSAPEEQAAARTILMLNALRENPCELSATHAVASDLILDDCATDPHFRALVEARRIRFRLRPNGESIRQSLIASLRDHTYRMDSWRGIWPEAESGDWKMAADLREAAVAVLQGDKARTGHDGLDKRLDNADALLRSIEKAGYTVPELPHAELFARLVRNSRRFIRSEFVPVGELLENIVTDLTAANTRIDRSSLYTAIEKAPQGYEKLAKGVVDSLKSRAVAYSLDENLLSMERAALVTGAHSSDEHAQDADIDIIGSDKVKDVEALALEWKDVHQVSKLALGDRPTATDVEIAREKIVAILSERRFAAPSRNVGAVVSKGASAAAAAGTGYLVLSLTGALSAVAVATLNAVAVALGAMAVAAVAHHSAEVVKAQYKADTERKLGFWLGATAIKA